MNDHEKEKIYSLFRIGFNELGIHVSDQSVSKLIVYCAELIKWNKKVNLIAKNTSLDDIVEKHFLDSLTLIPILESHVPVGHLLDVGSGAGFPGLVVKTARPDFPVTLLEPRQRRVSFLNHIIRILKLSDIEVLSKRTDELENSSSSMYKIITGRAVADVHQFLNMIYQLALPGTLVVCMQGASGEKQWESEEVNQQFSRVSIDHVHLPFSKADRYILLFQKKNELSLSR